MSISVPYDLPAIKILEEESIFINRNFVRNDSLTCEIVILNLMPNKEVTETDLLRVLSFSNLPINVTFMKLASYTSKHVSQEHMDKYYSTFDQLKARSFDGLIVTGAPVETLDYEEVLYWQELVQIFDWAKMNVRSSLYICWAAQAALYHFYNIPKYLLSDKLFGVFKQKVLSPDIPLFKNMSETFNSPQSRNSEIRKDDIEKCDALKLVSESLESGVHSVIDEQINSVFVTGHLEYPKDRLKEEYLRDLDKNIEISEPLNYFTNNKNSLIPNFSWQEDAKMFFRNWIEYYVAKK